MTETPRDHIHHLSAATVVRVHPATGTPWEVPESSDMAELLEDALRRTVGLGGHVCRHDSFVFTLGRWDARPGFRTPWPDRVNVTQLFSLGFWKAWQGDRPRTGGKDVLFWTRLGEALQALLRLSAEEAEAELTLLALDRAIPAPEPAA